MKTAYEVLSELIEVKKGQLQSIEKALKDIDKVIYLSSEQKITLSDRLIGRNIQLEEDMELYEKLLKEC